MILKKVTSQHQQNKTQKSVREDNIIDILLMVMQSR